MQHQDSNNKDVPAWIVLCRLRAWHLRDWCCRSEVPHHNATSCNSFLRCKLLVKPARFLARCVTKTRGSRHLLAQARLGRLRSLWTITIRKSTEIVEVIDMKMFLAD